MQCIYAYVKERELIKTYHATGYKYVEVKTVLTGARVISVTRLQTCGPETYLTFNTSPKYPHSKQLQNSTFKAIFRLAHLVLF